LTHVRTLEFTTYGGAITAKTPGANTPKGDTSHFIWPDNKAEVVTMTSDVLHALLDGDDITAIRRHTKQEYLRVS
jgi:hypothetical protein